MKIDLSANLCGIKLKNPTILASGILGINKELIKRIERRGAGAIVTKTIGASPRIGYNNPTIIEPMENVIINAMGLPNPGYRYFIEELGDLKDFSIPIIPSIFGGNKEEFIEVAKAMEEYGAKVIEVNISCPHSKAKSTDKIIAQDGEKTAKIVRGIREEVKIPIIVKLSPNVTEISKFAKIAIENGADAISAINTLHALEIDPYFERPILGNMVGGQSGPSIRCIAQKKIAEIMVAMESGEIEKKPVIGIGGIRSGMDIARFLLLGVECVQIGSSIIYDDIKIFNKALNELKEYMKDKGYLKLGDFRGNALKILMGK